jgi:hypothetical protein
MMRHAYLQRGSACALLLTAGLVSWLLLASACSGEPSMPPAGVDAGADGDASAEAEAGPVCPESLIKATNTEFCEAGAAAVDCEQVTAAYTSLVCSVPLIPPAKELARSQDVKEHAGAGDPRLDCFTPAGYPSKGEAPKTAQVNGTVRIFSKGCNSKQVKIEFFNVKRTGDAGDGDLGDPVGTALSTGDDCATFGTATSDAECGTRYECKFIYPGVPTETELVIRTSGAQWATAYEYNVYIPNAEVVNGVYTHDIRAVANDDPAAGIGVTVPGNGAIVGEVHDCEDVRLQNVVVGLAQPKAPIKYFTADEAHPTPDDAATGTTALGLFAAFNLKAGPVTLAAEGLAKGTATTTGYFTPRVFSNAVTLLTLHGLRPFQVP